MLRVHVKRERNRRIERSTDDANTRAQAEEYDHETITLMAAAYFGKSQDPTSIASGTVEYSKPTDFLTQNKKAISNMTTFLRAQESQEQ
jgi:hypothetical protein